MLQAAPCGGAIPGAVSSLSNIGFFGALPSGARGERISGDTPETPPGAAPLDPAAKNLHLKGEAIPLKGAKGLLPWQLRAGQVAVNAPLLAVLTFQAHQLVEKRLMRELLLRRF